MQRCEPRVLFHIRDVVPSTVTFVESGPSARAASCSAAALVNMLRAHPPTAATSLVRNAKGAMEGVSLGASYRKDIDGHRAVAVSRPPIPLIVFAGTGMKTLRSSRSFLIPVRTSCCLLMCRLYICATFLSHDKIFFQTGGGSTSTYSLWCLWWQVCNPSALALDSSNGLRRPSSGSMGHRATQPHQPLTLHCLTRRALCEPCTLNRW